MIALEIEAVRGFLGDFQFRTQLLGGRWVALCVGVTESARPINCIYSVLIFVYVRGVDELHI